jgi:hypothetical protein
MDAEEKRRLVANLRGQGLGVDIQEVSAKAA